ncbi:hypothetical protein F5Y10DRAFT_226897 [Nemania abortiva]|nr:hypothetical protein F5Y10DRAFT_226897 [Nemania abortiva]
MAKPPGRRRFTKTPRNRRREVTDGNTSEDSKHPSSDSSESSGGGVSLRPSMCSNGHKNAEDTRGPDTDDDAVGPSQHSSPLGSTSHRNSSQKYSLLWSGSGTLPSPRLGGQPDDSMAKKTSSTSDWALEVSSMISTSRPASPDNTTLIQPIKPSSISVPGSPQARASSPTPNWIMLGGGTTPVAIHGPDQQEHTHHTNTAEATSNQTARPRGPYVAYVEDATDSEEEVFHTDSLDSLAVETGNIGDYRHPTASREQPEQSRFFDDEEQSTSSPVARSPSSHSYSDYSDDWTPDELHEESNTEETQRRPVRRSLRKSVPTPYQSSSSEDMNHTRSRPKHGRAFRRRILRPRRTNTPDLQNYPNPPRSFAPNAPASRYAPPPSSYQGYGPYPGLYVPPYAPSAPIQSYEPPFAPYNPYYSQYTDAHAPSGYPNYVHYQRENPAYFTPNPNYSQPPPPPSTIIPEPPTKPLPLDPGTSKLTPRQEPENAFHIASAIKTALSYNPPTSSDPSGHEISFQIPLKCPSAPDNPGKQKSVMFGAPYGGEMSGHWDLDSSAYRQSGKSYLTRIQSLEYYVDRSSQGRITILPSQLTDTTTSDGGRELRWLHLQHDTLCISHLRELIRNCRYIDEDLRSLTDGFLEVECTRFEKKYSVGSRHGYYIEPGTVLRCDVRCDQEPDRGTKSVFFCSVPYLQLGKHGGSNDNGEEADMRLHPARTLMESLYDYDLPDDRDNRQAILRCLSPEQESILYIPQTWYILCGSEILISYSQLSLDEIRGDSIKAQDESSGSLIAFVTDLDNNQFSVALKPTDSYFSVRASIEALRSNASGNTIHDYDLVLDNDEHLIAKNWLDIVDRDPLPSLKITLKSRSKTDKRSLALIVRDKNFWPAKKFIADSSASDDDNKSQSSSPQRALATRALNLEKRDRPHSKSLSSQRRAPAHAYALTSYKGSTNVLEADANDLTGSDIAQHHEHFDESYTPTLVDSLQLRQENDRRRIQEFDSRGIIINDILSVSNEPEVFQVTEKAPETGSKPTVWDYLVNKWDVESSSPDDQGDVERDRGSQDVSTSTAGPNSSTIVNDNTQTVKKDSTIEPPVSSSYTIH